MTEPGLSIDEEVLSPDIFADVETMLNSSNPSQSDDSSTASVYAMEPEPSDDIPEWKGVSMSDIKNGRGTFECQELLPVCPSANHTVLISLPLPARGPPKPYPDHQADKWCQGYVRLPHSVHSLYPTDQTGNGRRYRNRWEIIQESLLRSFNSSHRLETAILSYNHMYAQRWDFTALHHFFSEVMDEDESKIFFDTLMPKMVQLALQLPALITGAIPLLKRHSNACITFSQLQVASLLANAFFCTFPRRNSTNPQSEYATYPYINFNRLFSAFREDKRSRCTSIMEKLKCILHYFRRVTSKAPEGVITIQRRYIPKKDCPKWDSIDRKILPLHITSRGTIETEGAGLLQVDFANKYIGGGVLGFGCVQEEIRFVICPELMVAMLVTEVLDDTEALIIGGAERYSQYEGYSNNFKWMGDFVDETPRDSSGRRMTSIVAIDALFFKQPSSQFDVSNIVRELNKAYVGFVGPDVHKGQLPAVATGNWGCGAFRGNPKLKVLLQLMAAAVAGRSMVYFTFGDAKLRDDVAAMYSHLTRHKISIAHLYSLFEQYHEAPSSSGLDFYQFLYNRSRIKPLTKYFSSTAEIRKVNSLENKFNTSSMQKKTAADVKTSERLRSSETFSKEKFNFNYNVSGESAQEKRIQNWLTSLDENGQVETEKGSYDWADEESETCADESRNNNNQTTNSEEKEKKLLLWPKIEKSPPSTTLREKKGLNALDALDADTNEQIITNSSYASASAHYRSSASTVKHEACEEQTRDKHPTVLHKESTPTKKSSQKKISDFFQRSQRLV